MGTGNSTKVYKCLLRGAPYALKLFATGFQKDREYVNFRNESGLLQSLHHPNIVRGYGAVMDPDCPAIIKLELCHQGSFSQVVEKQGAVNITTDQKLYAIKCLAVALENAHSLMVAHRDIKPDNVFVNGAGQVLLGDFGLAKILSPPGMTQSSVGTENYKAPEVGSCHGLGWFAADMWSFAANHLLDPH